MADTKSPAREYLDLLSISQPEVQKRLDNANSLEEFADVLGIPPRDALGPFLSRSAYFANPQGKPEEPSASPTEEKQEKKQTEHDHHSYHEENDPDEQNNKNSDSNITQKNDQKPEKPKSIFRRITQKFKRVKPAPLSTTPEPIYPAPRTTPSISKYSMPHAPGQSNPLPNRGRPRPSISRMPPGFRGKSKMLGKAGKTLGKAALRAVATNPYVIIVIGAIAAITIIVIIIMLNVCQVTNGWLLREVWAPAVHQYCNLSSHTEILPPPIGTTIEKNGPEKVENDQPITYTIKISYDPLEATASVDDLTLIDAPGFGHEILSADAPYRKLGSPPNEIIAWSISDFINPNVTTKTEHTFTLTIRPTVRDERGKNTAIIEDASDDTVGTEPDAGDYTPWDDNAPQIDQNDLNAGAGAEPSHYTCGGKYTRIMTQISRNYNSKLGNRMRGTGTNFGDPVCSFSETKLREVITQSETQSHRNQGYIDFWMEIARCESPGNGPNGWGRSFNTWGQFQMDRTYPNPGKPYNTSREPKRGDLPWQRQAQEAITRNNDVLGGSFKYWEAAYCLCGSPRFSDQPYCSQITAAGLDKKCSSCPR